MENPLLSSDINTLKELLQEPILYIKEEFNGANNPSKASDALSQPIIIQTVGENNKGIAFLVFTEDKELTSLDKDLYTKTLAGLKLKEEDVAFGIASIDLANHYDIISLGRENQRVVCFANTTLYNEKTLLNSFLHHKTKLLPCPSLHELSTRQDLKIKWWNGLKAFLS